MGYDGTAAARPGVPALTTFRQDFRGIARETVRLLLSLTDQALPEQQDTVIRGRVLEGVTLASL